MTNPTNSDMNVNMAHRKLLIAFDFDHTLVDENTDLYIKKLAPGSVLPANIKATYSNRCWTNYMGAIFKFLHENGVSSEELLACVREIPFVQGMESLLRWLQKQDAEVLIISDSNSAFINTLLDMHDLHQCIKHVYTNPAKLNDDDVLTVDYYHTQDWCDLSTVNLCKGSILEEHIKTRRVENVEYETIAYVGDGWNDLCPCLRLSPKDLVFPRKEYKLAKAIGEYKDPVVAKVVPWGSGDDIKDALEEKV